MKQKIMSKGLDDYMSVIRGEWFHAFCRLIAEDDLLLSEIANKYNIDIKILNNIIENPDELDFELMDELNDKLKFEWVFE